MSDVRLWFGEDADPVDPPQFTLEVDENPVVAVLLGPDGDPISVLRARPRIPFGFSK